MRAIAYFRLTDSTPDALASMEHDFKRYCTYEMHQPYQVFFTEGPGVGTSDAAFRRMVEFLESSDSSFLVTVPDASHLGGDLESIARSIVKLDSLSAEIKCWDDEYPDPFQNTFNTQGIAGVSVTRSRKVKEAMEARALEGNVLGRVLYGYRAGENGNLEIVPDEASVVELIFRLYTQEELGFRLIAQELNERGIKTRRGGSWNVVSIRDIIRNRSYIGTYERFGIRRPGMHEAIIPREVFNEAAERLRSRKPTGRIVQPEPFLLSGFVYCGYCGNKMMGVTRRQSWRRKTDNRRVTGVYRYYQCQSKKQPEHLRLPYVEGRPSRTRGPHAGKIHGAGQGRRSAARRRRRGSQARGRQPAPRARPKRRAPLQARHATGRQERDRNQGSEGVPHGARPRQKERNAQR